MKLYLNSNIFSMISSEKYMNRFFPTPFILLEDIFYKNFITHDTELNQVNIQKRYSPS